MNDESILIAGIVAVSFVFFSLVAFNGDEDNSPEVTTPDRQETQQLSSGNFDESFLRSCSPKGGNDEYCTCVLEDLKDMYTYGEMIDRYMEDGEEMMREPAENCIEYFNYDAAAEAYGNQQ